MSYRNIEDRKNYLIQWRKNNPDYYKNYQKELRRNPRIRLDDYTSTSIRFCLKNRRIGRSWEFLVGYTLQDLIFHLESQFDEFMSWDNYGSYWEIDHIVPKSWFPYQTAEEQAFKDCWDLANLQPLIRKMNRAKRNRFISLSVL